jgi:solute:Na+ symporter, SSS family
MLDLAILLAFVVYSVTAGLLARRAASRGLPDYFLAGRSLRGWQAGTSMAATQFAADTPLLVAGLIATSGVFMLWRLWVYGLAFLLLGFLFAAHWQRSRVLTDAELTEVRYSGGGVLFLRTLKAIYYGTVINCAVLAMVLIAAVGVAEAFLPWHDWLPAALYEPWLRFTSWTGITIASALPILEPHIATANNIISIMLIVAFIALYSMTGGLRGVVATDLMQFALMIVGMLVFAYYIVQNAGPLREIPARLIELYGEERGREMISFAPQFGDVGWAAAFLPFLVVMSLQWVLQVSSDGTGYLAQRAMACRTERDARWAGVTFAWLQIFLRSLPWLVIGVGLLVIYPFTVADAAAEGFRASREMRFVQAINELLPSGVRGLLLTGMLAALASTLDTHMNWGASYWSNDIYKRLLCRAWLQREPGQRELVIVARLSNLLILLIALIVMLQLDSIGQAWELTLLFGAGVGSVLILRWLWERINLWSELGAMAVSLVVAPILLIWGARAREAGTDGTTIEATNLLVMGAVSTAVAIGITFVTPRTTPEMLKTFYERVHPAGFWRRTAIMVGDDPRRAPRELARELITTAVTGSSLFLCLYGAGRLLIPHPDVSPAWPILALVLGAALVPLWVRRAGNGSGRR